MLSPKPGVFLILGGPSASGKTSLMTMLRKRRGAQPLLTSTSRPPRPGEVAGVDYVFLSPSEFSAALSVGDMKEHTVYAGVDYGVRAQELNDAAAALSAGTDVVAALDARGVAFFRAWAASCGMRPPLSLFLDVPEADMRRRLTLRGSAEEEVARRLRHAQENERTAAYVAAFDGTIDNRDGRLEEAYADIVARMA